MLHIVPEIQEKYQSTFIPRAVILFGHQTRDNLLSYHRKIGLEPLFLQTMRQKSIRSRDPLDLLHVLFSGV
jgi:hypothetical protein